MPPLLFCTFFSLLISTSAATKAGHGYKLISIEESPYGGLIGRLKVRQPTTTYGPDVPNLLLYVKHETENRLRVHVTDADHERWEVPYELLPREKPPTPSSSLSRKDGSFVLPSSESLSSSSSPNNLIFSYVSNPFGFSVKRKSNGETLFNSSFDSMVFKDQYLEISTDLPENSNLYGLGENTQPKGIKLQPNDPYTLYTTDISAINLNSDLYGSHPFYMDLRKGPNAHGVLLLNSNGMDVFYRGSSLTYKVIGGIFDFYFFAGPTPLAVVDQHTSLVGRPAPMPYWTFGFHQCRWGYKNVSVVQAVVEGYDNARIPLDVIWNDDDHMDAAKDFTLDPVNYPPSKLQPFLKSIHGSGRKYVVLIDPGIAVNASYGTYSRGMAQDVFIKYHGQPYLAQVWPGPVYFPDFLNPKTSTWWADEIARFHQIVPVDGLWIDMNEISNFCSGLCEIPKNKPCPGPGVVWTCCLDCKNITDTRWDDPPYKINASGTKVPIGYKTIATSAVHYNGVLEYNAHSLYGLSQAKATQKALQGLEGKRPFVLTRSTFVGSGKYAAHWTGDNQGTWENLRYSISTMLNFGIFGMPMVGADICGFYPDTTEELCNRWIELGAFYPFSRDHANYYSKRQELYQWETVAESARNALGLRYKLLPYFYTLNFLAHTTGAPIARPVFFSFPDYGESYGLSTQFLLGSGVMVSPVLKKGASHVCALFPPGTWYSLFDMTRAVVSKGGYVTLDAPLNTVNVHLYQNMVLPMQRGGRTSKEARATPFHLVVSFPAGAESSGAEGELYLDDDEKPEMGLGRGTATHVKFYASIGDMKVRIWSDVEEGEFAESLGLVIEKVTVLGAPSGAGKSTSIMVGGETLSDMHVKISEMSHVANVDEEVEEEEGEGESGGGKAKRGMVVEVGGLALPLGKKFDMSWQMEIAK
ncbi:hypothetical protein AMTRI_Chr13g118540 [Amborella trichopoda]